MADDNITVPQLPNVDQGANGKAIPTMKIHLVDSDDTTFEHPIEQDGSSFHGTLDDLKVVTDGWREKIINFEDVQAAANNNQIVAFSLPGKAKLLAIQIKHNTPFVGAGLTEVSVELGLAADTVRYNDKFLIHVPVSDDIPDGRTGDVDVGDQPGWTTSTNVLATFRCVGGLLDALQAGELSIYYRTELLP